MFFLKEKYSIYRFTNVKFVIYLLDERNGDIKRALYG